MAISRIMIIGGPGSGKTWLSRELGVRYCLPVHAVDDEVWDGNGALRLPEDIDARVRRLAAPEAWIIEGGNTRTYDDRAQRADAIIRLVPPIWRRLCRVVRRDGLRKALLRWTLRYDRVFGPQDVRVLRTGRAGATCIEIRSTSDMNRLLRVGIEAF